MTRSPILALLALLALGGMPAFAEEAPASDGGDVILDGVPPADDAEAPDDEAPDDTGTDDLAPEDDSGTPAEGGDAAAADVPAKPAKRLPGPITHDLAGPYLAARQAASASDFTAAGRFFQRALKQDPADAFLIDSTLVSLVSAGQIERAVTVAEAEHERGDLTELGGLVLRAELARLGDWKGLQALIAEAPTGGGPNGQGGELLDGMLRAWAELGAGRATEAMAQFEALRKIRGTRSMIDYNLALVKALVGDYEGAAELLGQPGVGAHMLGSIAHAEVLAQLDRRDEALTLLEAVPGASEEPQILDLSARLASGQPVPFTALKDATDGIAQTMLTFATALASGEDEPDPLALIHARLASWLAPDLGDARLIVAQLLQAVGQFDLAEAEYEALRRLGEVRPVAELARADALARAGRLDDAEKAALALTAAHPELASAWVALGDILRQQEKYGAAIPAYDKALALIAADNGEGRWFPLYARGIAHERNGNFIAAEADMRAALVIRPDQAQILNYLGYSFIDRGENLDEAMAMIEKAAELRPDDGYIQDSLAWGYFRLGRYDEAVAPMERAAESMSNDALVNDHLGDVYWKVGRQREAEVQWRRALSLERSAAPADQSPDPDRLRAKLERGLDAVLEDEAKTPTAGNAAPTSTAADDG